MDILYGLALSLHLSNDIEDITKYNFIHPQIRFEYSDFVGGFYLNSKSEISTYVGREFEVNDDLSFEFGIVDGYYSNGDIVPFGRVVYKDFYATPHVTNKKVEGVVIGYEFLIK
jgi:hypothetical protein